MEKIPIWFNEEFLQNYDEDSDKGYILEVGEYPEELQKAHSDLPFLPKRMKIDKCEKLVCNLYDKKNYVIHIRSQKQTPDHVLIQGKVYRVFEFNQRALLKPYIDMNTEFRKTA